MVFYFVEFIDAKWIVDMGCNPECYTKGRGCVISNQGRCALLFDEEPKPMINNCQEAFDALVKCNRMTPVTQKTWNKKNRKIAP